MGQLIYKILRDEEWELLQEKGEIQGAPVDVNDGFIHFSTADQVKETASKWFANISGLWIVAFDTATLVQSSGDKLKWEESRGGALFPHLYAPLRADQALWAQPLPLDDAGQHIFPDEMETQK